MPHRLVEGKTKGKREFHDRLDSEEEEETAPEKRLRLAKEYLSQLEQEGNNEVYTIYHKVLLSCAHLFMTITASHINFYHSVQYNA